VLHTARLIVCAEKIHATTDAIKPLSFNGITIQINAFKMLQESGKRVKITFSGPKLSETSWIHVTKNAQVAENPMFRFGDENVATRTRRR
jgi:hypothetical protein